LNLDDDVGLLDELFSSQFGLSLCSCLLQTDVLTVLAFHWPKMGHHYAVSW